MGSDLKPGHRSHDAVTQIGKLVLLVGGTGILLIEFPNGIGDPTDGVFLMIVGGLAVWRYTWWFTHFVRSRIYALVLFPRLRSSAQQIWNVFDAQIRIQDLVEIRDIRLRPAVARLL